MLALYIIGAIVAAAGIVLIVLKKATEIVNVKFGDWELTLTVGLFLVIIGVVILIFPSGARILGLKDLNPSQESPASPTRVTTGSSGQDTPSLTTSGPTLLPVKINPVTTPVPCRVTLTGTGDVPPGRTLWLVTQRSNTLPKYYFKRVIVDAAEHKWIAANITIGSKDTLPGSPYTIYAALVDNTTNQLITQGKFTGGVSDIPNTVLRVDQLQISRSSDGNGC
ncbi:MAG: hypothetical protein ACRDRW_18840 [Pseudonocardiaceae bacterium]